MKSKERGYISFAVMTLLIGGLALAGLLVYGWKSGQELPVWPAIAVALVNVAASIKIVLDVKKARKQPADSPPAKPDQRPGKRKQAR